MKNIDYENIDLNLLTVFHLLMQERSVTAVARRLSLGQPAISHSLARLRIVLGDPLFVRSGRLMEPTPRALALSEAIGPALASIESALRSNAPFDPMTEKRSLRISMSDDVQISFLPKIIKDLQLQMPHVKLIVQQADYLRAAAALEHKQASLVVGYLDKLPAAAKVRKIKRVGYRVLMNDKAAGEIDLETYCARPHVLVTFSGDLIGYIDEKLAEIKARRSINLSVPMFGVLPFLLAGSDNLATVPEYVARVLAKTHGMGMVHLPFDSPQFDLSMAWSATTDKDPAEKILRNIIIEAIQREGSEE